MRSERRGITIVGAQHAAPDPPVGGMSAAHTLAGAIPPANCIISSTPTVIPTAAGQFLPPLRSCGAPVPVGRTLS
jgi:hypothetical protein